MYAVNINGHKLEFTGKYYGRLIDPSSWQFDGVCPVCRNLSGRTNIGRTDYCFYLEHMEGWVSVENSFGDQKAPWYTEDIKRKNYEFLLAVSGEKAPRKGDLKTFQQNPVGKQSIVPRAITNPSLRGYQLKKKE